MGPDNKNTILFVDDEKRVLSGLKRLLYSKREQWNMLFVTTGREALDILHNKKIDIIVTDVHMPDISGIKLLKNIKKEHPTILRIGLSGAADRNLNLKALHLVHQYLPKPCDKTKLFSTLERGLAIKRIMEADRVKEIISQLNTLPSPPQMYYEILDEIQNDQSSIRDIGKIVSRDISMSTKVLQVINSAYFGLQTEITDPVLACVYLGLDTIKSLVLTVKIFDKFREAEEHDTYINDLWKHSIKVAEYSEVIAQRNKMDKQEVRDYWTAGLLHDIGKLVIAVNFPSEFKNIIDLIENGFSLLDAENIVLGSNHSELGAYLLGLWGLPTPLISTCAFHHYPEKYNSADITPVNVVHFANILENQNNNSNKILTEEDQFKEEYFESIGLTDQIKEWKRICRTVKA